MPCAWAHAPLTQSGTTCTGRMQRDAVKRCRRLDNTRAWRGKRAAASHGGCAAAHAAASCDRRLVNTRAWRRKRAAASHGGAQLHTQLQAAIVASTTHERGEASVPPPAMARAQKHSQLQAAIVASTAHERGEASVPRACRYTPPHSRVMPRERAICSATLRGAVRERT